MINENNKNTSTLNNILSLAKRITPIHPETPVEKVAGLFLDEQYSQVLTIPVVKNNIVIGSISRYDFMEVYLKLFGRELYENKPILCLMNKNPVKVSGELSIAEGSDSITGAIRYPIKEDFIIIKDRRYYGMGVVLDLLKAMESSLISRQQELDNAYTQLKSSQAQVVQSSKMAALGTMVAGVAHEINTPLGYVRGNVEVLKSSIEMMSSIQVVGKALVDNLSSDEPDEELLEEHIDVLSELTSEIEEDDLIEETKQLNEDTLYGLDQISEIVLGLKNFSRTDNAITDQVDINQALSATLMIAKNVIKGRVDVIKQFQDVPSILCSPSKLNQVLLNIITNAAQSMPEEHAECGQIIVSTYSEKHKQVDSVFVSIKDNGIGMSEEVKQKIFDPFFTTKNVGEGTGLGLSICHQIIEQHGGEIILNTEVGKGSEFIIIFPVNSAPQEKNITEVKLDGISEAHNSAA